MRAFAVAVVLLSLPASASADGLCEASFCNGLGLCFEERDEPYCLCDAGYAAEGVSCVATELRRPLRSTRAGALGERVVEIAMSQYGRRLASVGRNFDEPPFALSSHLPANSWWCTDFVAWSYAAAGVPLTGGAAGGWLVTGNDAAEEWFRQHTVFVDREHPQWDTFVPQPGDYVRFETARTGHSAIVRFTDGNRLHTVEGNVDGRVFVNRYDDFKQIRQLVGFGVPVLDNEPPTVFADADTIVTLPEPVFLSAHLEDDGEVSELGVEWRLVDGPGEAIFVDATSVDTELQLTEPGRYTLALDVSDGELEANTQLVVEALPEPASAAPPVESVDNAWAGCSASPSASSPSWLLWLVAAVVLRRRRGS